MQRHTLFWHRLVERRTTLPLELLGEGRMAEVFAWSKNEVLKLFRLSTPSWVVKNEHFAASETHKHGLPSPAVGPIVQKNGRWGILYERVYGNTFTQCVLQEPSQASKWANLMAELHVHLNAQVISGLRTVGKQPSEQRLCHGDFHPDNIIQSSCGPMIIDWTNAVMGFRLADVARTAWLLTVAALPPYMAGREKLERMRNHLYRVYLARYCQLTEITADMLQPWLCCDAATGLLYQNSAGKE